MIQLVMFHKVCFQSRTVPHSLQSPFRLFKTEFSRLIKSLLTQSLFYPYNTDSLFSLVTPKPIVSHVAAQSQNKNSPLSFFNLFQQNLFSVLFTQSLLSCNTKILSFNKLINLLFKKIRTFLLQLYCLTVE